jgi:hypothetical protein
MPSEFTVDLVPDGATGVQRVNFAVPLPLGMVKDETAVKILAGSSELPVATKGLAKYDDGSWRSIQVQVDVDVDAIGKLAVKLGVLGPGGLSLVDVSTTLTGSGNNVHPKVWALLPTAVLTASGVAGPLIPQADVAGTSLDAWRTLCDYGQWDTDQFLVNAAARGCPYLKRRARPSSARQIGPHARTRSAAATGGTGRGRPGRPARDARAATVAAGDPNRDSP